MLIYKNYLQNHCQVRDFHPFSIFHFHNAAPISLNALPKSLANEDDSPQMYRS